MRPDRDDDAEAVEEAGGEAEATNEAGAGAEAEASASVGPALNARQRAWTPRRREEQRERIMAARPWEASTGPRSIDGKRRSAMRGLKSGARSAAFREIRQYLVGVGKIVSQRRRRPSCASD